MSRNFIFFVLFAVALLIFSITNEGNSYFNFTLNKTNTVAIVTFLLFLGALIDYLHSRRIFIGAYKILICILASFATIAMIFLFINGMLEHGIFVLFCLIIGIFHFTKNHIEKEKRKQDHFTLETHDCRKKFQDFRTFTQNQVLHTIQKHTDIENVDEIRDEIATTFSDEAITGKIAIECCAHYKDHANHPIWRTIRDIKNRLLRQKKNHEGWKNINLTFGVLGSFCAGIILLWSVSEGDVVSKLQEKYSEYERAVEKINELPILKKKLILGIGEEIETIKDLRLKIQNSRSIHPVDSVISLEEEIIKYKDNFSTSAHVIYRLAETAIDQLQTGESNVDIEYVDQATKDVSNLKNEVKKIEESHINLSAAITDYKSTLEQFAHNKEDIVATNNELISSINTELQELITYKKSLTDTFDRLERNKQLLTDASIHHDDLKTALASFGIEETFAIILRHYVPRIFLAILLELVAFFFLKLYRTNSEDIKFFENELTNIEAKEAALHIAFQKKNEPAINEIVARLTETERNATQPEESTPDTEKKMIDLSALTTLINEIVSIFKK